MNLREENTKVLLIDDLPDNLKVYSRILEKASYQVEIARNSKETMIKLKHFLPDLILLDVNLGPESGIDLMKKIRKNDHFSNIYIVLISSSLTSPNDQARGLETGADGYIVRPIEKRELLARMDVFRRHKIALDKLRNSEARFRKIIFKNPDAILLIDMEGIIQFANPAAAEMFCLDPDKLIGYPFGFPLIHGENSEIQIVQRHGSEKDGEMRVIDIDWEGAKTYLTSIRDITQRKTMEESLRESEYKYRSLINATPLPLCSWKSIKGEIILENCNEAAAIQAGKPKDELIGISASLFYKAMPKVPISIERCLLTKLSSSEEIRYENQKTGTPAIIKVTFKHVAPGRVLVITEDRTESWLSEMKISAERDLANKYLNIAASMIMTLDTSGNITMINDRGARILECDKQQLIGTNWFESYIAPQKANKHREVFRKIVGGDLENYDSIDSEVLSMEGSQKTIRWFYNLIRDRKGNISGVICSGEDITERKSAEKSLKDSEIRYRELFNNMSNGVLICSFNKAKGDFIINNANNALHKIMQIAPADTLGNTLKTSLPGCREGGFWDSLYNVMKTGFPEVLPEIHYKDHLREKHLEISIYQLPGGETVAVFSDISERVIAENEQKKSLVEISSLSSRLMTAREDERKEIAGNLHDDLGQLLTALKMDLNWIAKTVGEENTVLKKRTDSTIEIVDQSIQSVQKMSSQLRPLELDHLGFTKALENYLDKFEKRSQITIEKTIPEKDLDLPEKISIVLFRIVQEALTNILRHAEAKTVWIEISVDKGLLVMVIRDDGKGIPPARIKDSESLGLIGMRERISLLGGSFEVSGYQGEGTSIKISLPYPKSIVLK